MGNCCGQHVDKPPEEKVEKKMMSTAIMNAYESEMHETSTK